MGGNAPDLHFITDNTPEGESSGGCSIYECDIYVEGLWGEGSISSAGSDWIEADARLAADYFSNPVLGFLYFTLTGGAFEGSFIDCSIRIYSDGVVDNRHWPTETPASCDVSDVQPG